jgi:hypothetical protein
VAAVLAASCVAYARVVASRDISRQYNTIGFSLSAKRMAVKQQINLGLSMARNKCNKTARVRMAAPSWRGAAVNSVSA